MLLVTEHGLFSLQAPSGLDARRFIWVCSSDPTRLDHLRATLLPDLGPLPPGPDGRGRWCALAPRAAVEALAARTPDRRSPAEGPGGDVVWVAKADLYGGIIELPGPVFLLRDPRGADAISVFPMARCMGSETPDAAARRACAGLTAHPLRILSALPQRFAGPGGFAAFYVMTPQPGAAAPPSAAAWRTAGEARGLIGRLSDPRARQRDISVLEAALAALG